MIDSEYDGNTLFEIFLSAIGEETGKKIDEVQIVLADIYNAVNMDVRGSDFMTVLNEVGERMNLDDNAMTRVIDATARHYMPKPKGITLL